MRSDALSEWYHFPSCQVCQCWTAGCNPPNCWIRNFHIAPQDVVCCVVVRSFNCITSIIQDISANELRMHLRMHLREQELRWFTPGDGRFCVHYMRHNCSSLGEIQRLCYKPMTIINLLLVNNDSQRNTWFFRRIQVMKTRKLRSIQNSSKLFYPNTHTVHTRDVKFSPKSGLGRKPSPHIFGWAQHHAQLSGPSIEPGTAVPISFKH